MRACPSSRCRALRASARRRSVDATRASKSSLGPPCPPLAAELGEEVATGSARGDTAEQLRRSLQVIGQGPDLSMAGMQLVERHRNSALVAAFRKHVVWHGIAVDQQ